MREIKFRVWDKEDNKMLIVTRLDFMNYADGRENKNCEGYWGDNHRKWFDKNNVELMQFTGLLDKNCKEIYEGDIVKCIGFDFVWTKVVEYITPNFQPFHKEDTKTMHWEIIGNIYENQELLK